MYDRTPLAAIFFFLALAALFYLAALLLIPYAAPVAWAAILAVVFHPLQRALLKLTKGRRGLAASISTVTVIGTVVMPTLLLSGVLAGEATAGYQSIAAMVADGRLPAMAELGDNRFLEPLWNWLGQRMNDERVDLSSLLLAGLRWASEMAAVRAAGIAHNVVSFFIGLTMMIFALFFALRDGAATVQRVQSLLPMQHDDRQLLTERVQKTILAVVQGITITAIIQGLLVGLCLWVLGIPFAFLLATIAGLLAFLPVGGAALVWVPLTVGLAVSAAYVKATILGLWCLLVVSSVDNIVRPLLIGSRTQLSTPLLFFGILGGLKAFGFIGLFIGPVILSTLACLVAIYRERYLT
ncbi:MAG: AI-2E family transporter [Deltaproteobacteria bacterium]